MPGKQPTTTSCASARIDSLVALITPSDTSCLVKIYAQDDTTTRSAAPTPWARVKVGDWARHPQALVRRAAYVVLRALARCDREMTDADFIPWSDAIPSMAAREEPVVRAAMLAALSAIGERNAALRQRVLSAASRLRCVSTASLRPSPPALRATAGDWRPMG